MSYLSFYLLLPVLGFTAAAEAVSGGGRVKSLPGYGGDLPFTLQIGYIGENENEEVQLFYYFVESQNNPQEDPLLVWVPGGPGCSALGPFIFGIGPLSMDTENYVEGLPKLLTNEYSWTKGFNIIFLDGPVGVGFSYTETGEDKKYLSDTQYAENTYEFIQKWLNEHPKFLNHPLYLSGEGYAGKIIPMAIQKIIDGNQGTEDEQIINVKGYAMGNPGTDTNIDFSSRVPFSHRLSLIPDDVFKEASESCNGVYFPSPSVDENEPCYSILAAINQWVCAINPINILSPSCTQNSARCKTSLQTHQLKSDCEKSRTLSESLSSSLDKKCSKYNQAICESWARDTNVQEALNIRQGKVTEWNYCSDTINGVYNKSASVVGFHSNFTNKPIRGLIFSGDHDWSIPFIGTQQWIESLNLPLIEGWRAWFVDGEVVGYMRKYQKEDFNLTFTTVKGAGHAAAGEYKAECYAMMLRWMAIDSL